ncbi:Uncharacterised protein [Shigella sonnei]|nr:Uncharacterised protein [Shigella sonnei]
MWFGRIAARFSNRFLFLALRQSTPEHIDLTLQILFATFLPGFLFLQRDFLRAFVPVHAVVHQRVARVQKPFYFIHAITFFALGNIFTGKNQIIDNRTGVGPTVE